MTQPALAVPIRRRGRHYPIPPQDLSHLPRNQWGSIDPENVPDDVRLVPSVTNCLDVIDKPALKGWAAEQAIRELYDGESLPWDVEQAVLSHKNAHNRRSKERAEVGTQAHTVAEALTEDLPLPEHLSTEDEAYADAFMKFWKDYTPEWFLTETTVYGDGYAGTSDLIVRWKGEYQVWDLKTRKARPDENKIKKYGVLYETVRMQLAALWGAERMAIPNGEGWDTEAPPLLTAAAGVVLFPSGDYEIEYVENLDRWYRAFCAARDLWNEMKGAG